MRRLSFVHQVPSDGEEHEKDSDDDPNIDAEHQNSPLARPGSSCGIHCRNIKLSIVEQRQLYLLAEGGNISLVEKQFAGSLPLGTVLAILGQRIPSRPGEFRRARSRGSPQRREREPVRL